MGSVKNERKVVEKRDSKWGNSKRKERKRSTGQELEKLVDEEVRKVIGSKVWDVRSWELEEVSVCKWLEGRKSEKKSSKEGDWVESRRSEVCEECQGLGCRRRRSNRSESVEKVRGWCVWITNVWKLRRGKVNAGEVSEARGEK